MPAMPALSTPSDTAADPLGAWVELREEPCRGVEGVDRLLVNHRDKVATRLDAGEADALRQLRHGTLGAGAGAAELLAQLDEQGFLATSPAPASPTAGSRSAPWRMFATTLDLRWQGADRLVQAVYRRGGYLLFRPVAVAAQIGLAVAGLAALVAAVCSGGPVHFRLQGAEVPVVVAVSLVAVAVHEFGHALVVAHHGRHIDAAGIRLHLGTPAFYVEAVDAMLLTRRQRLIQAGAGVWAEWMVTSVAGLWLWWSPLVLVAPLVHRFILLNGITIATNVAPFVGLDGHWLLADALKVPDLAQRTQGAFHRLVIGMLDGRPQSAEGRWLAVYSAANSVVAVGLLGTAGLFWYATFGELIGGLLRHGVAGWACLVVAILVLGRPAAAAVPARLDRGWAIAADVLAHARFRTQRRWRVAAMSALVQSVPGLASFSELELGVLAGRLERRTVRHADAGSAGGISLHGRVRRLRGTAVVTLPAGNRLAADVV